MEHVTDKSKKCVNWGGKGGAQRESNGGKWGQREGHRGETSIEWGKGAEGWGAGARREAAGIPNRNTKKRRTKGAYKKERTP